MLRTAEESEIPFNSAQIGCLQTAVGGSVNAAMEHFATAMQSHLDRLQHEQQQQRSIAIRQEQSMFELRQQISDLQRNQRYEENVDGEPLSTQEHERLN